MIIGVYTGLCPQRDVKEKSETFSFKTSAVWPENLAGIKFGGLALKGCELRLAD